MEKRKNPEKDLRKQSPLFFQIGLLMALMLAVSAFEYRTPVVEEPPVDLDKLDEGDEVIPPITIQDPPPPPKPVLANPVETEEPEVEDIPPEITFDPIEVPIEPPVIEVPMEKEKVSRFTDYAEEMPTPVGGYEAFFQYVSKHIKYPAQARRLDIEGKVFVQFIIDEEGRLTQLVAIKGVGAGLDEEAVRVLSKAPRWNPGRQGGHRVKVRMVLPINFQLH